MNFKELEALITNDVIPRLKALEEKANRGKFLKPSPQEITEYAKSIGFELDGHQFFDYYESCGWTIGKKPMKDWRAAVRTWKSKRGQSDDNQHTAFV